MRCCWAAAAALSTCFLSFSSCCWTDTRQHSPAFTPLGGIFTGFISGSLSKVSAGLHSATTFDVDTAGRRHSLYPCEYAEHRQLNAYNRHFTSKSEAWSMAESQPAGSQCLTRQEHAGLGKKQEEKSSHVSCFESKRMSKTRFQNFKSADWCSCNKAPATFLPPGPTMRSWLFFLDK